MPTLHPIPRPHMLQLQFKSFPLLQTARLRLREIVPQDASALYELRRHPEVISFLDREPDADLSVVQSLILSIRQSFDEGNGITWALELTDEPGLIGTMGFWRIDHKNHRAEIGYMLSPSHWRKGLMSEAMKAILEFGFRQINFHTVMANTAVLNPGSHRLLLKHGFVQEAHHRQDWYHAGKYADSIIFGIVNPYH
jgi:[ribosomal protein S5]-alanine N-acetyltransferase